MKVEDFIKEESESGQIMILAAIDIVPNSWSVICTQDEFCEWLENKENLSDYKELGTSDNGEGEYSEQMFINWHSVLEDHLNNEFIEKYIKSNQIKVR